MKQVLATCINLSRIRFCEPTDNGGILGMVMTLGRFLHLGLAADTLTTRPPLLPLMLFSHVG